MYTCERIGMLGQHFVAVWLLWFQATVRVCSLVLMFLELAGTVVLNVHLIDVNVRARSQCVVHGYFKNSINIDRDKSHHKRLILSYISSVQHVRC